MKSIQVGLAGAFLAGCALAATAEDRRCLVLKTTAEVEQVTTDSRGHKTSQLAPAEKIVPGGEVIYTVSAANVCDRPAENATIDSPVPEHMTYVGGSAVGPDADVTYSVDGGYSYGKPETLRLKQSRRRTANRAARRVHRHPLDAAPPAAVGRRGVRTFPRSFHFLMRDSRKLRCLP